jgi:hyperosmotically inducible periplasmic protein
MNKKIRVLVLPLALALFAGQWISAYATDNQQVAALATSTTEVQDTTLNDRVEALLRTDMGLAGAQFRVQTKSGVVSLAGNVPDEHALRRALDLVSGVKGVREVRNSMVVESPK